MIRSLGRIDRVIPEQQYLLALVLANDLQPCAGECQ